MSIPGFSPDPLVCRESYFSGSRKVILTTNNLWLVSHCVIRDLIVILSYHCKNYIKTFLVPSTLTSPSNCILLK